MDLQLAGKAAIVTGSSRGLGLASARALAAEGCRVCMCARGREALDEAAAGVPDAIAVAADLSTPDGAAKVETKVPSGCRTGLRRWVVVPPEGAMRYPEVT